MNDSFARHWKARTGADVIVRQARSRSGKAVDASVDGLNIVALALLYDRNMLDGKTRFIPLEWKPVAQNSAYASPYVSTIVFLVRKGNPKGLKDWDDLLRPGVEVLVSNPEFVEDGRWSYLPTWGYALKQSDNDEAAAREFVRNLFANVKLPGSDSGKRGATAAFVEHGVGDLLLAWENEAHLLVKEKGTDKYEIVVPSVSIAAERSISVTASGSGARDVAAAYIDYLYTHQAQDTAARHYYRPRDPLAKAKYEAQFPPTTLFTIDEVFGGWRKAEQVHFAKGGIFEQIRSN